MEKKVSKEFDQSEIDEQVEQRLVSMMRDNPARVMLYFVAIAGKEAVASNAEELTVSTEATINKKRYKITSVTTVEKVKPKK